MYMVGTFKEAILMAKGDYAVPQNIRDMKPKGTIVKKDSR